MFLTVQHAKFAAKLTIQAVATKYTKDALTTYTELDEDAIATKVVSGTTGMVVADNASPYADQMIDKINDWRIARKTKKSGEKK